MVLRSYFIFPNPGKYCATYRNDTTENFVSIPKLGPCNFQNTQLWYGQYDFYRKTSSFHCVGSCYGGITNRNFGLKYNGKTLLHKRKQNKWYGTHQKIYKLYFLIASIDQTHRIRIVIYSRNKNAFQSKAHLPLADRKSSTYILT